MWVAKWSQQPPDTPCDLWQNSDSGDIDGVTVDTDQVRSDRLMKIIAYFPGYQKKEEDEELVPDACPIDGPCAAADKTNVSGAFALLAEFLQTQEFQEAFLRYAEANR